MRCDIFIIIVMLNMIQQSFNWITTIFDCVLIVFTLHDYTDEQFFVLSLLFSLILFFPLLSLPLALTGKNWRAFAVILYNALCTIHACSFQLQCGILNLAQMTDKIAIINCCPECLCVCKTIWFVRKTSPPKMRVSIEVMQNKIFQQRVHTRTQVYTFTVCIIQ